MITNGMLTIHTTAKDIGAALQAAGLPVVSTAEPDCFDELDGEVVLVKDRLHVQVGTACAFIVEQSGDGDDAVWTHHPEPHITIDSLIAAIRNIQKGAA